MEVPEYFLKFQGLLMINNQALKLDKLLLEVEGPKKYVEREGNGNSGTK